MRRPIKQSSTNELPDKVSILSFDIYIWPQTLDNYILRLNSATLDYVFDPQENIFL